LNSGITMTNLIESYWTFLPKITSKTSSVSIATALLHGGSVQETLWHVGGGVAGCLLDGISPLSARNKCNCRLLLRTPIHPKLPLQTHRLPRRHRLSRCSSSSSFYRNRPQAQLNSFSLYHTGFSFPFLSNGLVLLVETPWYLS